MHKGEGFNFQYIELDGVCVGYKSRCVRGGLDRRGDTGGEGRTGRGTGDTDLYPEL